MVSTTTSRPNFYEMLGLKPEASDDEISQAFSRQMLSPRPMADAAQMGIAYATLRDPNKRKSYDRSLGLAAKSVSQQQWAIPVAQPRWTPFFRPVAVNPVTDPAASASAPEPHVMARPEPEQPAETELSPIAAALREIAKPGPGEPTQDRAKQPERHRPERIEEHPPEILAIRQLQATGLRKAEGRTIDWKYPAFAFGSLILAVGLLGGWAGVSAGGDAEAARAGPVATAWLPKARPQLDTAAQQLANAETQPARADKASAAMPRIKQVPQRRRLPAEQQVAANETSGSEAMDAAPDPLAPESGAAPVVAASMPLPGKVIARTIDRIGYSCGEVASTAAVEGAWGVYKVTCSSGQTYQATPVNGRYHFRRSGER